jgi:glyceraldehyde 3-phosphate dehydrogenase
MAGTRIGINGFGRIGRLGLRAAPYFERGVRKVIVAAPVKQRALNVVVGVNDDLYDADQHDLLTAASCTTNRLAPIVKVIHEGIGIARGSITTLHDVTNTQTVVDAPHKDLRRARAASMSLIPTTTGSATAIGLIFPELQGKLDGLVVRVPLLSASLTDCVFEVERSTSVNEVNELLKTAAEGPLAGFLGYEERPLVSIDYKDDPARASSTRPPRWSPTAPRSRSSPGTTTNGATRTGSSSSPERSR